MRNLARVATAAGLVAVVTTATSGTGVDASSHPANVATPIQHLVVIFQENVSFDHYFGTYPNVNGLTPALLTNNPNGVNPRRYDPANINDVLTCDQDHDYGDEQKMFDGGKMDKFVALGTASGTSGTGQACHASDTMNYYDGATVTGLWNYARQFSMSDNSFG